MPLFYFALVSTLVVFLAAAAALVLGLFSYFRRLSADAERQHQLLEDLRARLGDQFAATSGQLMTSQSDRLMEVAGREIKAVLTPLAEHLSKVEDKIEHLERARVGAYEGLLAQIRALGEGQGHLRRETSNLIQALRTPAARGRWGEVQLRRVVELAGMVQHCDFVEQPTVHGEQGRLRPDLVVRLPGNKKIIVDAKTVWSAFLESLECGEEAPRLEHLRRHAVQVRRHLEQLSSKAYWEQLDDSAEFIVLFLPSEAVFSSALQVDPSLIEVGVDHRVILATPTTLIALLRTVAFGWRQESLAENAKAVSNLGRELYERLSKFGSHMTDMGRGLEGAVKAFNGAVGSFESRVMVSARRFHDLSVAPPPTSDAAGPLVPITTAPRVTALGMSSDQTTPQGL